MTALGWSLPAGCSRLPADEWAAVDLGPWIDRLPDGVVGVFWDEDNRIIEGRLVTWAADEVMPEVMDTEWHQVATHPWDDKLSEMDNEKAAARAYVEGLCTQERVTVAAR